MPKWMSLSILTLLLPSSVAISQHVTVSGTVTDADSGYPLPGVSITVKDTRLGTSTGVEGTYSIRVTPGAVLEYSFVGYFPATVVVQNQTRIDVALEEDPQFFKNPVLVPTATRLDSMRVYELGTIVMTAERGATIVANTTSATSVIGETTIRRLPNLSVADLLSQTPGMSFFSLDGLGYDPQPVVRGFYGGGEAEYVQLQLNGEPISDMESGLVNWNIVPTATLQSVEILRGGSSALYGDAAVGAVINMITQPFERQDDVLTVRSGAFVPFEATFTHSGALANRRYNLFAGYTSVDGFRDHAKRDLGSIGARMRVTGGANGYLNINTEHHWNYGDVPGPVLLSASGQRDASLPFFRYDRVEESIHRLGTSGRRRTGTRSEIEFSATASLRKVDAIETIPLSAGFADTQQRDVTDLGARGSGQFVARSPSEIARFVGGVELTSQWIDSRYYSLLSGTQEDYSGAPNQPERSLAAEGSGARQQLAAFAHYDIGLADRLRIAAGARLDLLLDRYDAASADVESVTHTALSPKLGLNYRLISNRDAVTNVYANLSRSFKAPTFDQLYDQRAIPVPFPPFQVSLSSTDLQPQYGTSYEAGVYQRLQSRNWFAEVSVAVYQIDMRDEIDFDIQLLRYRNLGKSRHRGVETEARIYVGSVVLQGSYAYQETQLRFGDFDGNFVKAIPRDIISAGLSLPVGPVEAAALLKSSRRIFIDDANTTRLPNYTTVDTRLIYTLGRASITAEIFNLFDAKFSTTGFPDPAGSDAVFVYPFTGRHVRVGATVRFP